MKMRIGMIAALLSVIAGAAVLTIGCGKGPHPPAAAQTAKYHCPMHPTVVSDKPGDCPICGMRLAPMEESGKREAESGERKAESGKREAENEAQKAGSEKQKPPAVKKTMYRSTMNPGEVSDKPGKDSMGMAMESFEVTPGDKAGVAGLAAVSIAPEARRRMGLALDTVGKRALARNIRTSARIVADETRLFRVTTKVEGWVEKLFVSVTGQAVRQGDPLLTIYSPQLVSAQQEYLTVVQAAGKSSSDPAGDVGAGARALRASARQRLQLWDISDEQIARLEKTGQVEKTLTLYAPAGGYVTEKNVLAGQKIMPGEPLMVVGDLTRVWGDADIYESDLPYVKTGMAVEIALSYWPGKVFKGTVSFIAPTLDPETRTLRARLEIDNPDLALKPEMYANAHLRYELGERLVVPEQAVMRTGLRNYVFREGADGKLAPVEIELGARGDGHYEVLSGLNAGDKVVTSANFLVDSESSMKAALEALTQP
ncbi:MAG: efflux RND transporter periplasmic adaptor subunit [Kiritimatiellia bacterium]|jgi:Cu(I)/Ag(I) efflux system membrane fusion protein/cobalt-zinc-cadmium efflux system membrane fusion protein